MTGLGPADVASSGCTISFCVLQENAFFWWSLLCVLLHIKETETEMNTTCSYILSVKILKWKPEKLRPEQLETGRNLYIK